MVKSIRETARYATGLFKIIDHKTPAQLIFFVTNRCNAKCSHCFYWQKLNQKTTELTLKEIQNISKSMGKMIWLFISGGEPFLRSDLAQICATFYKNNKTKSIIIPTNGILVAKICDITEKICQNCPEAKIVIQVSIDEIGKKHDQLRGYPGAYGQIERLFPRLKNLQQQYPNLALQSNLVFCRANQDRIKTIYQTLEKKLQPDNICLSLIRGQPKNSQDLKVDLEKYRQMHEYLKKQKRFNQYSSLISYLITKKEDWQKEIFLESISKRQAQIPCLAGKQSAVLYPDGDLARCELRHERFGNLREVNYDFSRLWEGKQLPDCYCTQECVYTTNVFLNPLIWPRFIKYLLQQRHG